ncbi:SDR family oxidoreductase [Leptolyngbya sp. FACHB-541]|uniref:SDR family oxidoreductase n=1 Tax=Leptolyngbya sp. FACHB-541 TaxID=2692810 RepID=UPI0016862FAE|nr:SDR family oxidoreductase [Leptolyngbya sp. FACHB-541]MBD1998763.1 SDR family oxidoreductase [Leptolyngbya sp. FACHB-541]
MTAPYVFLAGASRGVGLETARGLVKRSLPVKALLRSEAARAELEAMGIAIALGDALNLGEVEQAMQGESIGAVISTIGGLPKDGERADYLGNKNLIDAAVKAGAQKFILVSSIGSGDSVVALPPQALQALGEVLVEKEKAEQHLIASGLTYTIIRPGGLKSEPATGNAVLTPDPTIAGSIHRADVAELVCRCLQSDLANNRVLSAVDQQMLYGQKEFEKLEV